MRPFYRIGLKNAEVTLYNVSEIDIHASKVNDKVDVCDKRMMQLPTVVSVSCFS